MLTRKEEEVYNLIGENGYSLKELADILVLSRTTCKSHYDSICRKLDLSGTARGEKLVAKYWKDKFNHEHEHVRTEQELNERLNMLTEKYHSGRLDLQQKLLMYGMINGLMYALKTEDRITEVGE